MLVSVSGLIIWTIVATGTATVALPYPNELRGYELHARASWRQIKPLVSTQAEVVALLGQPDGAYYDAGPEWSFVVLYVGSGSCNGQPFPPSLVDKVDHIEVIPKTRVSFRDVSFPATFRGEEWFNAHAAVGSWSVYKDDFGLEYHVYEDTSKDSSVQAGDLKAIVYGPSHQAYLEATGCE